MTHLILCREYPPAPYPAGGIGAYTHHIAHLLAWAIERGETAAALLKLPFYHPTFEEGLKPALREIC